MFAFPENQIKMLSTSLIYSFSKIVNQLSYFKKETNNLYLILVINQFENESFSHCD